MIGLQTFKPNRYTKPKNTHEQYRRQNGEQLVSSVGSIIQFETARQSVQASERNEGESVQIEDLPDAVGDCG